VQTVIIVVVAVVIVVGWLAMHREMRRRARDSDG
jgi:uncharacterized membrane protein YqiK